MNFLFNAIVGCRTVSLNMASSGLLAQVPAIPADIEFYTLETAECLRACFERQNCHVVVFMDSSNICKLFLNVGLTNLTLQDEQWSQLYTIKCIGKMDIKR